MRSDLVIDPFDLDPPDALEAARLAEAAGFDAVWMYDHLSGAVLGRRSSLDVWTALGAIAASTSRIGLGPLVANVTTRHPAVTAVAAATLSRLAPGRVTVGLGAGAGPGSAFGVELDMIGVRRLSAATRRQMVADAAGTMRAIWTGAGEFDGEHFGLEEASGFLEVDPPPIVVGCNGPAMTAVASTVADGVNFHSSQDNLEDLISQARQAAPGEFEISVEAPQECDWTDWLAPDGEQRRIMSGLGVDRVMVVWHARAGLSEVSAAGRVL